MKRTSCVLLAAASALLLSGCSENGQKLTAYDAQYLDYFDTITSITICAASEEQFQEYKSLAEETLEKYHELFDIYDNYDGVNNIKTINDNAGIDPVTVDPEILDLLEFSRQEYEETGGKVNVAMGSVLSIWHEYREEGMADPDSARVPDLVELEKAAQHTDFEQIQIDRGASTVYLPDEEMSLDVGAIAKGYATKRLAETLKEAGVTSALLSLGGNVETIGLKADGKPWRVGVQNPDTSAAKSYLHVLKLADTCLVTSGTYQRYYEVDGVRYHHIIDPDSLMPENIYDSVTILCSDSAKADALSTAVFNMKPEEGMKFVESLDGVEALWVYPDGKETQSSGFAAYVDQ